MGERKTISESKGIFHKEYPFVIPSIYRKVIDEISTELSIPIIYYEDLYGSDRNKSLKILKTLDLDLDVSSLNEKLHPKFKYRQERLNRPLI